MLISSLFLFTVFSVRNIFVLAAIEYKILYLCGAEFLLIQQFKLLLLWNPKFQHCANKCPTQNFSVQSTMTHLTPA